MRLPRVTGCAPFLVALAALIDVGGIGCEVSTTRCGEGYCPSGTICLTSGADEPQCALTRCRTGSEGFLCVVDTDRGRCVEGQCLLDSDCGNGLVDDGEVCDPSVAQDPGLASAFDCARQGHIAGAFACNAGCGLTSRCWDPGWQAMEAGSPASLFAVRATREGRFYAGGSSLTMLTLGPQEDGWQMVSGTEKFCSPEIFQIVDLWVTPRGDRGALVTENGQVMLFTLDGAEVTDCETGSIDTASNLWDAAIWMSPEGEEVWAINVNGEVWRWAGGTDIHSGSWWREEGIATPAYAVWGRSADEVTVGGMAGEVWRWNGQHVSLASPLPSSGQVLSLWGPEEGEELLALQAGEDQESVLRWRAGTWSELAGLPTQTGRWRKLAGASDEDVWLLGDGGSLAHLEGQSWASVPTYQGPQEGLAVHEREGVVTVGSAGSILRWRGRHFTEQAAQNTLPFYAVSATSDGSAVFAAGDLGTILRFDRDHWQADCAETSANLRGIWIGDQQAFAVGFADTVLTRDATCWRAVELGERFTTNWLAVHGTDAGEEPMAVAVGTHGAVRWFPHAPGSPSSTPAWVIDSSLEGETLYGVWVARGLPDPEVWAVGRRGTIHRFVDLAWQRIPSPLPVDPELQPTLYGVWGTTKRVVVVGKRGTLWNLDREAVTPEMRPLSTQTPLDLHVVWAPPDTDELFVAGFFSTLLYFNGERWSSMKAVECRRDRRNLWALGGTSRSDVFAAGDAGCLLHFTGRLPYPR